MSFQIDSKCLYVRRPKTLEMINAFFAETTTKQRANSVPDVEMDSRENAREKYSESYFFLGCLMLNPLFREFTEKWKENAERQVTQFPPRFPKMER